MGDRHARTGLVLSWGNQAGEGHVNMRPREEVERLFSARGFRSEVVAAEVLRKQARLPWLRQTVLVLERRQPLVAPFAAVQFRNRTQSQVGQRSSLSSALPRGK